jgi:hypothetical protein
MMLKLESQQTPRNRASKLPCNYLFALLLALMPPVASAADGVKAVFIKTTCAGKISSVLLSNVSVVVACRSEVLQCRIC